MEGLKGMPEEWNSTTVFDDDHPDICAIIGVARLVTVREYDFVRFPGVQRIHITQDTMSCHSPSAGSRTVSDVMDDVRDGPTETSVSDGSFNVT